MIGHVSWANMILSPVAIVSYDNNPFSVQLLASEVKISAYSVPNAHVQYPINLRNARTPCVYR